MMQLGSIFGSIFGSTFGLTLGMPLGFERPIALLILVVVPALWWMSWRRAHAIGTTRAWVSASARTILIALIALSLSQPSISRTGEGVTVLVVADVSRSIPSDLLLQVESQLQKATKSPPNKADRVGVVTIAREAIVAEIPSIGGEVSFGGHGGELDGSNLALGVRRGLALLPADTMNRLLLVSDGNETAGTLREAAALATANRIPIDVYPIEYNQSGVTVFEGIRAPTRARIGQTADLKLLLRSQGGARGTLYVKENGIPVDLDSTASGDGLAVELKSGPNTFEVPMSLDSSGAQRYEAVFEPDAASADGVVENKKAAATIFVSGDGRILVVDRDGRESGAMVSALRAGGLEVEVVDPSRLAEGVAFLAGYDAVILMNIARYEIDNATDRMLHAFVHDLGGGILVVGGDSSFGAGGWIDSELAKALPVKLDPPATRELPRGALALVMHSCEMPQANYWSEIITISAIEALSRLDYVGIVVFGFASTGGVNGAGWFFPMQLAGDKTAAIEAARKMPIGDMPDFNASMTVGLAGLKGVKAGQRHAIVISDGDPAPPTKALIDEYKAAKITITTIMIAGHGTAEDLTNMKAMAELTGGNFYNVVNPKLLPKIFIKEASLVSRNLIVEGDFQPVVAATLGGPIEGITTVPPVKGYVLTVPREGLAQIPILNKTSEGNDPIYAYWNYGLGKSAVFASDLSGRWGSAWPQWAGFQGMWERSARWLMRPATPSNVLLKTRLDGEEATVDLEAMGGDDGLLNFMRTDAKVIRPDGTVVPLMMEQVAPGRYRGTFQADETGSYLVDIGMLDGAGGRTGGSIQGALSLAYPREFRTSRDNAALLRAVATQTGGRVLSKSDLETGDLFERRGLAPPESVRRIWDILAIIAAALLVIDVAVRRLVFDRASALDVAQQAFGSARGTGGEVVAAWKRARTQAGKAGATSDGAVDHGHPAHTPRVRDASAKQVSQQSRATAAASPSPAPVAGESSNALPDVEAESSMDRLKRAKKRALQEDADSPQGGGADGATP
ncbi:MAG: hypothetical protein EXS15_00740 [Phycisphaerales bacterium]|nr:hypothetical protein [Phycisphaerales bacterium]